MPVRFKHLINDTVDDNPTSVNGSWDFNGVTPKRVTLYVVVVESGSGASLTLTVEVSPDDGQTLVTYDKLITHTGVDGPVSSVAYTATADDIISISAEDVLDYIKVTVAGTSTTSSNKYTVDVWLCYIY